MRLSRRNRMTVVAALLLGMGIAGLVLFLNVSDDKSAIPAANETEQSSVATESTVKSLEFQQMAADIEKSLDEVIAMNASNEMQQNEEWYSKYHPLEVRNLPPVKKPAGTDIEELATMAALEKYKPYDSNHIVLIAPHVFDHLDEGNTLTIWATVYYSEYALYGQKLVEAGGGIVPAAIRLKKDAEGYRVASYTEAQDGSGFTPSIRAFCKGRLGLADKILKHYGNYEDLFEKMKQALQEYLQQNAMEGLEY